MPIPPGSATHAAPVSAPLTAPLTAPKKTRANGTPRGGAIRACGRRLIAGRAPREDVLLPATVVTDIITRGVVPSVGGATPERLARSRADDELRQDVYHRLRDCQLVRLDLPGIAIHARDGVVWLQGHVSSDGKRRRADDVLRGLDGMLALHNELVADTALAAAVAMALANDPRTARQRIGVYPYRGVMRLRGIVRPPTAHADAWEIAAAVPLVKQVVNELRVDPDVDVLPDLAGVTNNYDLVPGGR
jgi:osmotically-inducible protein OsmY